MKAKQQGKAQTVRKSSGTQWNSALWSVIEAHFFSHIHLREMAEVEIRRHGIGLAHHRALTFIYKNPGITAGQLTTILGVSSQALNTVLGLLIRRGLVAQETGETDRRIRHLHATEEGCALFEAAIARQFDVVRRAALSCGPEAVRGFVALADAMATDVARDFMQPLNGEDLSRVFEEAPSKLPARFARARK